jgi:hypothetical protein
MQGMVRSGIYAISISGAETYLLINDTIFYLINPSNSQMASWLPVRIPLLGKFMNLKL